MGVDRTPFFDSKKDKNAKRNALFKGRFRQTKKSKGLLSNLKKDKFNTPLLKKSKGFLSNKNTKTKGKNIFNTPLLKPKKYVREKYSEEKKKQIRRLRRFIKSAEKRGYIFDNDIIDTSKSAEELKQITPEKLYKRAKYYDYKTNQVYSGEKGKEIEKYRATQKAKATKEERAKKKEALFEDKLVIDEEDLSILEDNLTDELDYWQSKSEIRLLDLEFERAEERMKYEAETIDAELNEQFKQSINLPVVTNLIKEVEEIFATLPNGLYYGYKAYYDARPDNWILYQYWLEFKGQFENDTSELYDYLMSEDFVSQLYELRESLYGSSSEDVKTNFRKAFETLGGALTYNEDIEKVNEYYNSGLGGLYFQDNDSY